jgi:hypothetical protein
MLKYKFVYKGDIIGEYLSKTKRDSKKLDPLNVSVPEQISAMIDKFQELGSQGWRYAESFRDFGAYLFVKDGKKKWKYNLVSLSKMEKDARSKDEQVKAILKGMNKLGEEGWTYVTCLYFETPVPRIEILVVKETSGAGEPISSKKAKKKISELTAVIAEQEKIIEELEQEK